MLRSVRRDFTPGMPRRGAGLGATLASAGGVTFCHRLPSRRSESELDDASLRVPRRSSSSFSSPSTSTASNASAKRASSSGAWAGGGAGTSGGTSYATMPEPSSVG